MVSESPVILVVDDETPVRISLAAYLEDEGFAVRVADSAENALETVVGDAPDAAVVDLRLPGMDGASFIIEMAKRFPGMLFLIHTGSTKFSLSDELKALGMREEHIFFKPVLDMAEMADRIRSLLGKRSQ